MRIAHTVGRTQDRAISAEDDRQIGRMGERAGVVVQIDRNNVGILLDQWPAPFDFSAGRR